MALLWLVLGQIFFCQDCNVFVTNSRNKLTQHGAASGIQISVYDDLWPLVLHDDYETTRCFKKIHKTYKNVFSLRLFKYYFTAWFYICQASLADSRIWDTTRVVTQLCWRRQMLNMGLRLQTPIGDSCDTEHIFKTKHLIKSWSKTDTCILYMTRNTGKSFQIGTWDQEQKLTQIYLCCVRHKTPWNL